MKKILKYRRMTKTDRLIIERLYNNGASCRSISFTTGFAVSSIHTVQHTKKRQDDNRPGVFTFYPLSKK